MKIWKDFVFFCQHSKKQSLALYTNGKTQILAAVFTYFFHIWDTLRDPKNSDDVEDIWHRKWFYLKRTRLIFKYLLWDTFSFLNIRRIFCEMDSTSW